MVMSRFIKVADPNPGWKAPLVSAWAGMRGVVSLAAALSIPVMVNASQPFPFRNLILFITFIVILITLALQGLTLPWIIRKIKMVDKYSTMTEQEQEVLIQRKIAKISLAYLEEHYGKNKMENKQLATLVNRLEVELDFFKENAPDNHHVVLGEFQNIYLGLLNHQRTLLEKMNLSAEVNEDLVRKYQGLIDIEEYKIREKLAYSFAGDNR